MANGSFFPDCRMGASTFTASGLATIATGAWPELHGIVADRWFGASSRNGAPITASSEFLAATTLSEQAAVRPNSRVYAAALDQRAASLVAGRAAARVFWMVQPGQFAALGGVSWLPEYNRTNPAETAHNAKWQAVGARPDAPPLRTLSWDSSRPSDFAALYAASPYAQTAAFEFAREVIARERLGQGEGLDCFWIVPGSMERLGYETGAHSPLMDDMVLRLDREIGALLQALDRSPGAGNYNLVITAAHGAPPAPSPESRARLSVPGDRVVAAMQSAGVPVRKYLYPFLYLDTAGREDPEALRVKAGRAALGVPSVANFYTAGGHCSVGGEFERRFRNSFHPVRSGDVMLSYAPEAVEDFGAGRGISYGSLYNYDVRVPLLLYGPQFRAEVFEDPIESIDLAPTLARACGVPPPSSSTGRVLAESFADAKLKT